MKSKKKESRYRIVVVLAAGFDVYEGDNKISGHLSRSNAEAAIERYEAADRRRAGWSVK